MAKPKSIRSYRQSERSRDVMLGLFALWQRGFPNGIGIGKSIAIKESIVGGAHLAKIGYEQFFEIIDEIEKRYKKLKETKKCKL